MKLLAILFIASLSSAAAANDLGFGFADIGSKIAGGSKAYAAKYSGEAIAPLKKQGCLEQEGSYVCSYSSGSIGIFAAAPNKDAPIQSIRVLGKQSAEHANVLGAVVAATEPGAGEWRQGLAVWQLASKNGVPSYGMAGGTAVFSGYMRDGQILVTMFKP